MVTCAVPGCNSSKKKNPQNYSFHVFPTNIAVREKWMKMINREGWIQKKNTSVCSVHFEQKYFSHRGAQRVKLRSGSVPTLFMPIVLKPARKVSSYVYRDVSPLPCNSTAVSALDNTATEKKMKKTIDRLRRRLEIKRKKLKKLRAQNKRSNLRAQKEWSNEKMTHDGADSDDSDDASKTIGESDVEISEEKTDYAEESDTTDPIALTKILNIEIDYDNIDKFGEQIAFLLKRIPKKLCRELQDSIVTLVKTAMKNHESKTKRDAIPSTSSKTIVSDVFSNIVLTPTLAIKPDPNEEITIKEEPLYRSDENNISIDETTQSIQIHTQKIQLDQRFTSTIKTFPKPMTVPMELVGTLDCVKKEILAPGESSNNSVKYRNNEENYFRKTLSEPLVKIEMVEIDANSECNRTDSTND